MVLDLTHSAALRITTALMVSLPLALPALAQEAKPKTEEEVQLDLVSVYADRQGAAVTDIPASVLIVEGSDLQARGLNNMKDVTRYMPGVNVPRTTSGANPLGNYSGFNIRGVGGNRVQMMVDGARTPEAITDGTRDYLDFSFTKQVDVVKGPASVLWGADALAGVVAVETLDPEDILMGAERGGIARLAYDGLNSETSVSSAFAQRFGPNLALMLGVSRTDGQEARLRNARADGGIWGCPRNVPYGAIHCGELDPTDASSTRVLTKATWTPSDAHRFEFTFDGLNRKTDIDVRWGLGPIVSTNVGTIGDTMLGNRMNQEIKRRRYAVEHTWAANQSWVDEVKTTLSYSDGGYERYGLRRYTSGTGATAGNSLTRADWLSYDEKVLELDIQAKSRFVTGSATHDLVWGFDGDLGKTNFSTRRVTSNLTAGTERVENGVGFNFAGAKTRRADIYVQDKISLMGGALELTPGLRYATYSLDPRPLPSYTVGAGNQPVERSDSKLLKSLGALYRFGDGWQIWGHYGEGFKMPTAEQLFVSNPAFGVVPNPNLRPEYVEAIEVGLRKEFDQGNLGITAFKSDYEDFIRSLVALPGGGYGYQNYNQVKVWGIEVNGAYRINETLRLSGSASWQRGNQIVTTSSAKTPFTVAPLQATLGVTYDLPERGLSFDVVGTFAGAVKRTAGTNDFKPAGYGVIDAFARWDVAENAVLNLGVKNLFDKRYFDVGAASLTNTTSVGNAQTQPLELQTGAGRVFNVSLDMKF